MESRCIRSIIGEIAEGMKRLLRAGCITRERRVLLYGLGRYSYAMRTILANAGFRNIEGYVSDDEAAVIQCRMEIRNFASRYLNGKRDLLRVWTLRERLQPFDADARILLASKEHAAEKAALEALGYREGVHFFTVYDFTEEWPAGCLHHMTRMSPDEVRAAEKEILQYVDGFCREKRLRYWVGGGTLLGTMRHKGFIPWDDDIDLLMPWEDYRKFIAQFDGAGRYGLIGFGAAGNRKLPHVCLKVADRRTAADEDIGTVRELGYLFVDIFPLIGMPADAGKRHRFFMEYQELHRRIWQSFYAGNGDIGVFSGWAGRQKEFMGRYDFDDASWAGVLGSIYGERDCTRRSAYDQTIRLPFADITVNVFAGYEEYLGNHYGTDWMRLPPVEQRKSHHDITFYRAEVAAECET